MFKKANPGRKLCAMTAAPSSRWDPPAGTGEGREGKSCAPLNQPHLHHPLPPTGSTKLRPGPGQGKGFAQGLAPARARGCFLWHQESWGASSPAFIRGAKEPLHPSPGQAAPAAELCRAKAHPKRRLEKSTSPGAAEPSAPRHSSARAGRGGGFLCSLQAAKPRRRRRSQESPSHAGIALGAKMAAQNHLESAGESPAPHRPAAQPRPCADALQQPVPRSSRRNYHHFMSCGRACHPC